MMFVIVRYNPHIFSLQKGLFQNKKIAKEKNGYQKMQRI